MDIGELRKKSNEEIEELLNKTAKELESTSKDILQRKEKNVKKPGRLKKDIARIKTVLKEKQILKGKSENA